MMLVFCPHKNNIDIDHDDVVVVVGPLDVETLSKQAVIMFGVVALN